MNWKELFDEDRLDRGYSYYLSDRVFDVILTENSIISKVEGSRSNIYEVKITFDKDEIQSLYCTCPYSYADFNCKHMVATLYKMEEISDNTKNNILDKDYNEKELFSKLIGTVDENRLRRFIYDKFNEDKKFMEDFINTFQDVFTPEDFNNYETMLDNIFNIDVVELYNENGYFQEAPFHKYLENFINDKISLLYKNKEYDYVLQLLYIIYENISEKVNVTQYIEVDNILNSCNYYMEKIIDSNNQNDNEEIFNYLINKIEYDFNSKTTKYLIDICFTKFNRKIYLKQLDKTIDVILNDKENIQEEILLTKIELMKLLDYPTESQKNFLKENKHYKVIMDMLIEQEIKNKNVDKAICYLNENKEIHGNTDSLESTLLLLSLYKYKKDEENAIKELETIIYEYNIKDMYFIKELKNITSDEYWDEEKDKLIEFYEKSYSFEFLNDFYVEEEDYDSLYHNIVENCNIKCIEEYDEYIRDKYHEDIILLYKNIVLEEAKVSKNISGYSLIMGYLEKMLSYKNSSVIIKDLIKVLKNKYSQKKLFMEKIEEFEIINSL